jgi:protein TonB
MPVAGQAPAEKLQHCSIQKSGSPTYPDSLKGSGIQGTVIVEAVINEKGCTESLHIVQKLNPQLDELARQSVNSWKFTPATKDGRPVAVMVRIPVEFKENSK